MLTLKVRENTAGSGGLSPHYTLPMVFTLPIPSHCNLPLSLGAPADHQGQAFLPGLQDPRSLSFLGPRQHQDPPENTQKELVLKAEEGRGGQRGAEGGLRWGGEYNASGSLAEEVGAQQGRGA